MLAAVPLAFAIAVLIAGPVARRLEVGRGTAFVLAFGVTGVLAITLIPRSSGYLPPAQPSCLIPVLALPAEGRLLTVSDESLNVLLFAPLGIALGLLVGHPRFVPLMVVAVGLPWAIEAVQLFIPRLGRVCQSTDITANLLGLLLGVAIGVTGSAIRAGYRHRRRLR